MPRQEHDREDMLVEARALVERVSLRVGGRDVLIGFRRDQGASIYLGDDRVYQFTSAGQLRRAFVGQLLYKAERAQLVSLRRERHEKTVELVRQVLDRAATQSFFDEMRSRLDELHHALAKGHFTLLGQVPADVDMIGRIDCWLDEFADRAVIARSPRAG